MESKVKKQLSPTSQIIKQYISIRGLYLADVKNQIGCSYPTLRMYVQQPMTMNGIVRQKFANALHVESTMFDRIINGEFETLENVFAEINKTASVPEPNPAYSVKRKPKSKKAVENPVA
jgi:hypothetical protein